MKRIPQNPQKYNKTPQVEMPEESARKPYAPYVSGDFGLSVAPMMDGIDDITNMLNINALDFGEYIA